MGCAGDARINQHEVKRPDRERKIERARRLGIGLSRKRSAHKRARVVVAGNDRDRNFERHEQTVEVLVLVFGGRIDQIAGNNHDLRPRTQAIELRNATRERRRGIDFAVGQRARSLDMQVGDLGHEEGGGRDRRSPGSSRTASGSIARPTRSPTLTSVEFATLSTSGRSAAPVTISRARSPTKLTASTRPQRAARSGGTIAIASGRTIAVTAPAGAPFPSFMRPPGSFSSPFSMLASRMFAAPTNSATNRLCGEK